MVRYNPREWFSLIFQFHKSDTFRAMFWVIVAMGVYTGLITFVSHHYDWHLPKSPVVHSLLGLAISLLLVFRTNTAYERWWEGRKLWGALLNSSRSLAIRINILLPVKDRANREYFSKMISNYAVALKDHLRDTPDLASMNLDSIHEDELSFPTNGHLPNYILHSIYSRLKQLQKKKVFNNEDMLMLDRILREFTDITGACERIRATPIPYSYSIFLKKFIFIYVSSMPFAFVADYHYWSIFIVCITLYVLVSLELIAVEIEDPFGKDANDLPSDLISEKIRQNVHEILRY